MNSIDIENFLNRKGVKPTSNRILVAKDADKFEKAIAERETICRTLKEMGFLYITLDLEGFRSGSMDIVEKLNALVGK